MSNIDRTAKTKLADLVQELQPVIHKQLANFNKAELEYILKHYKGYLKLDLARDVEETLQNYTLDSTFDDLLKEIK